MWSRLHDWDAVLAEIHASRLEDGWHPGRKAGYHAYSAWFVLAELVQRLSGMPYSR